MGLTDALVVLGIFGALGLIIFSKMAKDNPKMAERMKSIIPNKLYNEPNKLDMKDKVEQVWDSRMM